MKKGLVYLFLFFMTVNEGVTQNIQNNIKYTFEIDALYMERDGKGDGGSPPASYPDPSYKIWVSFHHSPMTIDQVKNFNGAYYNLQATSSSGQCFHISNSNKDWQDLPIQGNEPFVIQRDNHVNNLNLSEGLYLNIYMECWENDCCGNCVFNPPSDDWPDSSLTITRFQLDHEEMTTCNQFFSSGWAYTKNSYYGIQYSIKIENLKVLSNELQTRNSDDQPQAFYCEGDEIRFVADRMSVTGGIFEFQRSFDNGNTWEQIQVSENNYIELEAAQDMPIFRGRLVRNCAPNGPNSSGNCRRCFIENENSQGTGSHDGPDGDGWIYSQNNFTVLPRAPGAENVEISTTRACEGLPTGSVEITLFDVDTTDVAYDITLYDSGEGVIDSYNDIHLYDSIYILEISSLTGADYSIRVTRKQFNAAGNNIGQCTSESIPFNLPTVDKPEIESIILNDAFCYQNQGGIILNMPGGQEPVWANMSDPEFLDVVTVSPGANPAIAIFSQQSGDYKTWVTFEDGCSSDTLEIPFNPQSLDVEIETITLPNSSFHVSCDGLGTIRLTPIFMLANTNVYIDNNLEGTFDGLLPLDIELGAGTYEVLIVYDGCENVSDATNVITQTVQLLPAPSLSVNPAIITNGSCTDQNTVEISLVSGEEGTAPIEFRLRNTSTGLTLVQIDDPVFHLVPNGEYEVWVTDATLCFREQMIEVGGEGTLSGTVTQDGVKCNWWDPGTITITAEGGVPEYEYAFDGGDFDEINEFSMNPLVNGTAFIKDASGCIISIPFTVEYEDQVEINYEAGFPRITAPDCQSLDRFLEIGLLNKDGRTVEYSVNEGIEWIDVEMYNTTGDILVFPVVEYGDFTYLFRFEGSECDPSSVSFSIFEPLDFLIESLHVAQEQCPGSQNSFVSISLLIEENFFPFKVEVWRQNAAGSFVRIQDILQIDVTTVTLSGLQEGTYFLRGVRSDECFVDSDIFEITPATPVTASLISIGPNIFCSGNNGVIEVANISGGNPPYQYSLNNGPFQSSPILEMADLMNTVQIRDANNCPYGPYMLEIPSEPNDLIVELDEVRVIIPDCEGQGFGILQGQVSPGKPPYQTAWAISEEQCLNLLDNEPFSYDLTYYFDSNLPNTYFFCVKDSAGCTAVSSIELTVGEPLVFEFETEANECIGDTDGSINITISGGTAPFRVVVNNQSDTLLLAGNSYFMDELVSGTYRVEIIDARDCAIAQDIVVPSLSNLSLDAQIVDVGPCSYSENGSISVNPSGGIAPYNIHFLWDDDQVTMEEGEGPVVKEGLAVGDYSVIVTDNLGCALQFVYGVSGPIELSVVTSIQNATCEAVADGSISILSFTPASAQLQYSIGGDFVSDANFADLATGAYVLTVKDEFDCILEVPFDIGVMRVMTATAIPVDPDCFETATGQINISASNTALLLSYSLNQGPLVGSFGNSFTIPDLTEGTYDVRIYDAVGCFVDIENITLVDPPQLLLSIEITEDANCDSFEGTLTGTPEGGTPPYTFQWNGNPLLNSPVLQNVPPVIQLLQVTDSKGCTETASETISFFPEMSTSVTQLSPEFCDRSDGWITVQTIGGLSPLQYTWSHDPSINDTSVEGLTAGIYTLTITDANLCTDVLEIEVPFVEAVQLSWSNVIPAYCVDGTGSLEVMGAQAPTPYVYEWSHDPNLSLPIAENLFSDTYTVTVTDGNLCSSLISEDIDYFPPPQLELTYTFSNCNADNGDIAVAVRQNTGTAPFQYTWSHDPTLNANIAPDLAPGTYFVTVTDVHGCTAVASQYIGEIPGPVVQPFITSSTCGEANGSVSLSINGGVSPYQVSWNNGMTGLFVEGLAEGMYTFTLTDFYGCETSVMIQMNGSNGIDEVQVAAIDSYCNNNSGVISLSVEGGVAPYQYQWNHNALLQGAQAFQLGEGIYQVTVTDNQGCTFVISKEIHLVPAPSIAVLDVQNSLCRDGNGLIYIEGSGQGDLQYEWTSGVSNGPLADMLSAGTYRVTVTDENACTTIENFIILADPELELIIMDEGPDVCGTHSGFLSLEVIFAEGTVSYEWGHDPSYQGNTITGLSAGIYDVTVTDDNDCSLEYSHEIELDVGPMLFVDTVEMASCGSSDGVITLLQTGGYGEVAVFWDHDPMLNGLMASGLAPGVYTVWAVDENECINYLSIEVSGGDNLVLGIATIEDDPCLADDVSVTLQVTGGQEPYLFEWEDFPDESDAQVNGISSGLYAVTITDSFGCTDDLLLSIEDQMGPILGNLETSNNTCGNADGSAVLEIISSNEPLSYQWSHDPLVEGNTQSDLISGFYEVTVLDGLGCSVMLPFVISDEEGPELVVQSLENSLCYEGQGSIVLDILSTNGPYDISWSHDPLNNTPQAASLWAGNYQIIVTDADQCQTLLSLDIEDALAPELSLVIQDAHCAEDNGSVSLDILGGLPPYSVSWSSDHGNGMSLNGLSAGTYAVTVEDGNACLSITSFEIEDVAPAELTWASVMNANCLQSNGALAATVNGGAHPLVFQWSHDPELSEPEASGLSAGFYQLSVIDSLGCEIMLEAEIEELSASTFTLDIQEPACEQGNGVIAVEAEPASAEYTYAWAHDPTLSTAEATDLNPGIYIVSITDPEGCVTILEQNLAQDSDLEVAINELLEPTCNESDGSISLGISGAEGSWSIEWSHDAGLLESTASALSAGLYSATITDEAGCMVHIEIALEEDQPEISIETEMSLCGQALGTAAATFIEGATYTWTSLSDPDFMLEGNHEVGGLAAGHYMLQVLTPELCLIETFFEVADENPLILSAATTLSCPGLAQGSIAISVIDGGNAPFSYQWSHDSDVASSEANSLLPGVFQVTVTDAAMCSEVVSVEVGALEAPNVALSFLEQPSCDASVLGGLGVSVSGGVGPYQYAWNQGPNGSVSFATGLETGSYLITVTDAQDCESIFEQELLPELDFQAVVQEIIRPSCSGLSDASAQVAVNPPSGNMTFTWSDDLQQTTPNASQLSAGTYFVTITNGDSGCEMVLEVPIEDPNPLELGNVVIQQERCFGTGDASVLVSASGGTGPYSFAWNDPAGTQGSFVQNLQAGMYEVTITDASACSAVQQVDVPITEALEVTFDIMQEAPCEGDNQGAILASVIGGTGTFTFRWNDPAVQQTAQASGLSAGTYNVTVTDSNLCSVVETVTLEAAEPIILEVSEQSHPSCFNTPDGFINILASGGEGEISFIWSNAQEGNMLEGLGAGMYSVTVSDELGCSRTLNITLNVPPAIFVNATNIEQASCFLSEDGSIEVLVSGGVPPYSYQWSHDDNEIENTVSQLQSGSYELTITDANDCQLSVPFTVGSMGTPIYLNAVWSVPDCEGANNGSIILNASGGSGSIDIAWENGSTSLFRDNLSAGVYEVTATDADGCSISLDFDLPDGDPFVVSLGLGDTTVCQDVLVYFDFSSEDFFVQWSSVGGFSSNELLVGLDGSDTYMIEVSNDFGCVARDTIVLEVLPEPLQSFFVIATDVLVDEEVLAVEVSWPLPEQVEWFFPIDSVELISQEGDAFYFRFLHTGNVRLSMKSSIGACTDWIHKIISVHADSTTIPGFNSAQPEIISAIITPNPSSGAFSVHVELSGNFPLAMTLFDSSGSLLNRRILEGSTSHSEFYNLSSDAATYYIILQSPRQRRTFTISVIP